MSIHFLHWNDKEKKLLRDVSSFNELADVALVIMGRMPQNINVISGPISTGGVGTLAGNLKVFEKMTEILIEDEGINVLSWIPFEIKIRELHVNWRKNVTDGSYCMPILEDFYHPIFSSKKISKVHFIHGWESSFGSRWEHQLCGKLGIEIVYLSSELSQQALKRKSKEFSYN